MEGVIAHAGISIAPPPTGITPVNVKGFIAIEGMTCSACSGTVERCLMAQPGVVQGKVSLLTNRAEVVFNPSSITLEALCEEIENVGFGATAVNLSSTSAGANGEGIAFFNVDEDFELDSKLSSEILAIEGVLKVQEFDDKMEIHYDVSVSKVREIIKALQKLGVRCQLADNESDLETRQRNFKEGQEKETERWVSLLRIACLFTAPVFFLSMVIPMAFPSNQ